MMFHGSLLDYAFVEEVTRVTDNAIRLRPDQGMTSSKKRKRNNKSKHLQPQQSLISAQHGTNNPLVEKSLIVLQGLPPKWQFLATLALENPRQTRIIFMPVGMSRRTSNRTFFMKK